VECVGRVPDREEHTSYDTCAMIYSEDVEEAPYDTCCNRAVRNTSTGEIVLPSIEEIERVDTLARIPCTISKISCTRTPIMLVDCDAEWPAKTRWNIPDLMDRFENDTKWRAVTHYSDPAAVVHVPWKEMKEDAESGNLFYIFDQLVHPHGKSVERAGIFMSKTFLLTLARVGGGVSDPKLQARCRTWILLG